MGIFDDIDDALFPPFTVEPDPDTDADGLDDHEDLDDDGDGVPDVQERERGSNPLLADTDGDGLDDRREALYGGDPLRIDTDGDLLTDAEEVDVYGTDPGAVDSDGDGWRDGYEVMESGTDPARADSDADGLDDRAEVVGHGTNPLDRDTDGDGLLDGDEALRYGTDPNRFDHAQPLGALDHDPTVRDSVLDVTAAPGDVGPALETSALPPPSPAAYVAQVEAEGDLPFGVDGAAKGRHGGGYSWPGDPAGDPLAEAPTTTVEGRAANADHALPFDAHPTTAPPIDPSETGDATAEPPPVDAPAPDGTSLAGAVADEAHNAAFEPGNALDDMGDGVPFGAGGSAELGEADDAALDLPVETVEPADAVALAEPEPFETAPDFGAAPVDEAPAWVEVLPDLEPEPDPDPPVFEDGVE